MVGEWVTLLERSHLHLVRPILPIVRLQQMYLKLKSKFTRPNPNKLGKHQKTVIRGEEPTFQTETPRE
jgi:hypothetical protein